MNWEITGWVFGWVAFNASHIVASSRNYRAWNRRLKRIESVDQNTHELFKAYGESERG